MARSPMDDPEVNEQLDDLAWHLEEVIDRTRQPVAVVEPEAAGERS